MDKSLLLFSLLFMVHVGFASEGIFPSRIRRLEPQSAKSSNLPQIEQLNTQCTKAELKVFVTFSEPFNGLVYSRGNFSNSRCHFVRGGSNSRELSFTIRNGQCGTKDSPFTSTLSNILIFQMDDTIQEAWDVARKISCSYSSDTELSNSITKHGKMVIFKPLSVAMLDIQHRPITMTQGLDCWMDIQKGLYPNTEPIGGQIAIGEELSILIFLKDEERKYDVSVKDCWAYDSSNFDDRDTRKVQLTDNNGCSRKPKLFGMWRKTSDTGDTGATLIAFANITAFKFPDSDNVHLACNIELCRGDCEEESCSSNSGGLYPSSTSRPVQRTTIATFIRQTSRPNIPTPIPSRARPAETTPRPPVCYPGSYDPRCPNTASPTQSLVTDVPIFCYAGSNNPECINFSETSGQTESPFNRPTTRKPFDRINEEETDIQPGGYTEPSRITTRRPTAAVATYQTTRPPYSYQPSTTRAPYTYYTSTTTFAPFTTKKVLCYPGQVDPRCPQPTRKPVYEEETDFNESGYTEPPRTTTRRPFTFQSTTTRPVSTTRKVVCYPGQIDPRCEPECYPGSTDRRCPQTTRKPIYEEEQDIEPARITTRRPYTVQTTTLRPIPTTRKVVCYPGQIDPRCAPECYPGSADRRCPQTTQKPVYEEEEDIKPGSYTEPARITTRRPYTVQTTTLRPISTTKKVVCYPGQIDPRCAPECYPGSTDRRCPQTTQKPVYEEEQDIQPGYPEPARITTRKPYTFQTTTVRPVSTTRKVVCYPGQIDPRCAPVCYPGSTDRRCPQTTRKPVYEEDPESTRTTSRPFIYTTTTQKPFIRQTTQQPFTYPTTSVTTRVVCYPGQFDPRCPQPTTTLRTIPTTRAPYTYTTTSTTTPVPFTTKKVVCYPGQIDPRCKPVCDPGSPYVDRRCPKPNTTTTIKPLFEEESDVEPLYPEPTTTTPRRTTTRPTFTVEQSTDPRTFPTTTRRPFPYQPTTSRTFPTTSRTFPTTLRTFPTTSRTFPTTSRTFPTTFRTFPTTTFPPYTTKKVLCYPGQIDPRCPRPPTTTEFDGYTEARTTTTFRPYSTREPLCYPGQIDPRCPKITTTTVEPARTFPTTRPPYTYQPSTTTRTPSTTKKVLCYPGQIDPRCPPVCEPGSSYIDRRCPQSTTTVKPISEEESDVEPGLYPEPSTRRTFPTTIRTTTQRPFSYQPTSSRTFPTTTTTRPPTTTRKVLCYPGQIDPRCPPICTPGSTDRRCNSEHQLTSYSSIVTKVIECYPDSTDPACPQRRSGGFGNF